MNSWIPLIYYILNNSLKFRLMHYGQKNPFCLVTIRLFHSELFLMWKYYPRDYSKHFALLLFLHRSLSLKETFHASKGYRGSGAKYVNFAPRNFGTVNLYLLVTWYYTQLTPVLMLIECLWYSIAMLGSHLALSAWTW